MKKEINPNFKYKLCGKPHCPLTIFGPNQHLSNCLDVRAQSIDTIHLKTTIYVILMDLSRQNCKTPSRRQSKPIIITYDKHMGDYPTQKPPSTCLQSLLQTKSEVTKVCTGTWNPVSAYNKKAVCTVHTTQLVFQTPVLSQNWIFTRVFDFMGSPLPVAYFGTSFCSISFLCKYEVLKGGHIRYDSYGVISYQVVYKIRRIPDALRWG